MSSRTWHACPPGGDGLISHRSHRPCPCFFVAGTHYAAKSWPRAEVPRVRRWRGRSLGLVKHRDASESHPHQLSQNGWYGGNSRDRERKREEGRWAGEERKAQEQEKTGIEAALHTHWGGTALSSAGCFFQEEKRIGPQCCVPTLRAAVCVSPHALLLSLPTARWQALESTHSDSQCPLHPPSTQLLCHG